MDKLWVILLGLIACGTAGCASQSVAPEKRIADLLECLPALRAAGVNIAAITANKTDDDKAVAVVNKINESLDIAKNKNVMGACAAVIANGMRVAAERKALLEQRLKNR